MKIIQEELPKDKFIEQFWKQVHEFELHVIRVRTQYAQSRLLKEKLPLNEIILHMDFSENYSCKSVDEIQSAYWNKSAVTLHPIVIYYKEGGTGTLCHKSVVAVSDELTHSSATVVTILHALYALLPIFGLEHLNRVHYWTDSPTSQYRNKYIFNFLANHRQTFGFDAIWNYFEAGHGKGPCDGLGGTCKIMADDAVRTGKAVIQDSMEFNEWAKNSSMKAVHFFHVSKEDCSKTAATQLNTTVTAVKGTLKLHAVASATSPTKLLSREISCYCDDCLKGNYCDSWQHVTLGTTFQGTPVPDATTFQDTPVPDATTFQDTPVQDDTNNPQAHNQNASPSAEFEPGQFVAATYEHHWHIGKILSIDETDGELEISFMKRLKSLFQWPSPSDELWISPSAVLCLVTDPEPSGKSERMFKIRSEEWDDIERLFICQK